MKKKIKLTTFPKQNKDILSEIMEREGIDEMGLLDLVFIEEILNQKREQS